MILLLTIKAMKYIEAKYIRGMISKFDPETNITVRHATENYSLFEPRTNSRNGEKAYRH